MEVSYFDDSSDKEVFVRSNEEPHLSTCSFDVQSRHDLIDIPEFRDLSIQYPPRKAIKLFNRELEKEKKPGDDTYFVVPTDKLRKQCSNLRYRFLNSKS